MQSRRCSSDWQSESFVRIRSRVQIPPPAYFAANKSVSGKYALEDLNYGTRERSDRSSGGSQSLHRLAFCDEQYVRSDVTLHDCSSLEGINSDVCLPQVATLVRSTVRVTALQTLSHTRFGVWPSYRTMPASSSDTAVSNAERSRPTPRTNTVCQPTVYNPAEHRSWYDGYFRRRWWRCSWYVCGEQGETRRSRY